MLNWGLAAQSATATAIFMIMFTSSSTVLQFVLLGRLDLQMGSLFWLTGAILFTALCEYGISTKI